LLLAGVMAEKSLAGVVAAAAAKLMFVAALLAAANTGKHSIMQTVLQILQNNNN
jgi:hypothetical protein